MELGICFVFGDDWKIDEEKLQLIPAYDRDGNPVSRKVFHADLESLAIKARETPILSGLWKTITGVN